MKNILILVTLALSLPAFAKNYGKEFITPRGGALSLEQAIADLKNSESKKLKDIVVEGEISSVCQSKGCWISLKAPGTKTNSCEESMKGMGLQKEVRVMFKGHSFKVPKDIKGQAVVAGTLKKKKISRFQLRHLLKDAGCSKAQIKKVKKGLYKYQMVATGVEIGS